MSLEAYKPRAPRPRPSPEAAQDMDRQVLQSVSETLNSKMEKLSRPEPISTVKFHGAADYTVRIAEKRVDPLDPPRFRQRKPIALQQDDPAPILAEPAKKLTPEEERAWQVPACVSNWKNPAGYVIPMDKRVAADARRFDQPELSPKFAIMARALDEASASIAEAIAEKNLVQRQIAQRQQREEEARIMEEARRLNAEKQMINKRKGREQRMLDRLLEDRREERDALSRRRHRDTSARGALGTPVTADDDFDAQLFSRSGGIDSGYGDDDSYAVYDKPLFQREQGYVPFSSSNGLPSRYSTAVEGQKTSITFQKGDQQRPDERAGVYFPKM